MTREEFIELLAEHYGIERDEETGEYDLNDYDWQAGCYARHEWLSLAAIVDLVSPYLD